MSVSKNISLLLEINEDDLNKIEEVSFTSVWDDCSVELTTNAELDTNTGCIINIEQIDDESITHDLQSCDSEYITLRSGHDINVLDSSVVDIDDLSTLAENIKINSDISI